MSLFRAMRYAVAMKLINFYVAPSFGVGMSSMI